MWIRIYIGGLYNTCTLCTAFFIKVSVRIERRFRHHFFGSRLRPTKKAAPTPPHWLALNNTSVSLQASTLGSPPLTNGPAYATWERTLKGGALAQQQQAMTVAPPLGSAPPHHYRYKLIILRQTSKALSLPLTQLTKLSSQWKIGWFCRLTKMHTVNEPTIYFYFFIIEFNQVCSCFL